MAASCAAGRERAHRAAARLHTIPGLKVCYARQAFWNEFSLMLPEPAAAVLAKGSTVIENAAREPELVDLAAMLTAMGAGAFISAGVIANAGHQLPRGIMMISSGIPNEPNMTLAPEGP